MFSLFKTASDKFVEKIAKERPYIIQAMTSPSSKLKWAVLNEIIDQEGSGAGPNLAIGGVAFYAGMCAQEIARIKQEKSGNACDSSEAFPGRDKDDIVYFIVSTQIANYRKAREEDIQALWRWAEELSELSMCRNGYHFQSLAEDEQYKAELKAALLEDYNNTEAELEKHRARHAF